MCGGEHVCECEQICVYMCVSICAYIVECMHVSVDGECESLWVECMCVCADM